MRSTRGGEFRAIHNCGVSESPSPGGFASRSVLDKVLILFVFVIGPALIVGALLFARPAPTTLTQAQQQTLDRLQVLAGAIRQYAADHDGVLPGADWGTAIAGSLSDPQAFDDPAVLEQGKKGGFALNQAVVGQPIDQLDPATVLVFSTARPDRAPVGDLRAVRADAAGKVAVITLQGEKARWVALREEPMNWTGQKKP